jgi:glutamine amidotransferase
MSQTITMIDAGTGNLRSVLKAFESLGARVELTSDPEVVRRSTRLVLPGVGAMGDFMKGLRTQAIDEAVIEVAQRGDPLFGICVGMQVLFEVGEERGEQHGLGLLPGRVVHFPAFDELKVPHTGWNQLWFEKPSMLLKNIHPGEYAYFNHSYYCDPRQPGDFLVYTDYGVKFASAVQHANIYGVQFHPEKSQQVGLRLLSNFLLA